MLKRESKYSKLKEGMLIIGWYLFYSLIGVLSKYNANTSRLGSPRFWALIIVQLICFGIFTIGWQLILKYFKLSWAYVFKGTTIIWGMLFAKIFFCEAITSTNLLGGLIIIIGIGVALGD